MDAKDETMRLKKQSETKINELDSTIQTLKTQILKLNNDIKLLNMKLKD
jgi:outer membrane murein-binding lipoprotein Lpp